MPATKAESDIVAMLALLSDAGELKKRLTDFINLREAAEKAMADSEQAKYDAGVLVQEAESKASHSHGLIAAHKSVMEKELAELEAQRRSIAIVTKEVVDQKEALRLKEEELELREQDLRKSEVDVREAARRLAAKNQTVDEIKADLERRLSHLKEATV